MSFTPGPWQVGDFGLIEGPRALDVGVTPGWRAADRQLAAAAPELLAALIEARSALLTATLDTPEDLARPARAQTLERKIKLASAAIAKAGGGR